MWSVEKNRRGHAQAVNVPLEAVLVAVANDHQRVHLYRPPHLFPRSVPAGFKSRESSRLDGTLYTSSTLFKVIAYTLLVK